AEPSSTTVSSSGRPSTDAMIPSQRRLRAAPPETRPTCGSTPSSRSSSSESRRPDAPPSSTPRTSAPRSCLRDSPSNTARAPRSVDADPERRGGLVAGAGDLRRLVDGRQPLARDLERLEHLVAPAPPRHVEEERPRGVGDVDRVPPAQAEPHVVLRQEDVPDPRVRLRLVAAEPEELRRREPRQRAVPGQLDQPLEA